jgi:hypothetical protein
VNTQRERWTGNAAQMAMFETPSKCWSANFKRRHDNTRMDVKEIGCDVE